jgi:hypothetical protein
MKYFALIFATSLILFSCNQAATPKTSQTEEKKPAEKVVANKLLTFEIEGMTCVMGCGGSIRKELSETNAVEKCEFDFEADRKMNVVTVSYDENKTSAKELIKIVTKMNEGQFTVGSSDEKDISVNIKTTIKDVQTSEESKS